MIWVRLLLLLVTTSMSVILFYLFGGFSEKMNMGRLLICLFVFMLGFLDYSGPGDNDKS